MFEEEIEKLKDQRILFVAENPQGGAGIAAQRLFYELKRRGLDVRFLVVRQSEGQIAGWYESRQKSPQSLLSRKFIKLGRRFREWMRDLSRQVRAWRRDRFFHGRPDTFEITTLFLGRQRLDQHPWYRWATIIHLQWTAGFLSPRQPWHEKRWVMTLHDAYPLTAVCHFPAGCTRFESGCRECPQLAGTRNPRWSARVFDEKMRGYGGESNVTLVASSHWIADLASRSLLTKSFPSVVLPNLYPTEFFRLLDPVACRDWLGLPQDRRLALFVAGAVGNVRKGFPWFQSLAESPEFSEWTFVIVGGGDLSGLPGNCLHLGRLSDLRLMAAAYNSCHVFITTSLQDNLPSTLVESQLCGTPVIGFSTGGQPEMVIQGETGFLSPEIGVRGLSGGLEWYLRTLPSRTQIAESALARWNRERLIEQWIRFYGGLG